MRLQVSANAAVRLARSPARLLVVQYVGHISEAVIEDIASKVRDLRNQKKESVHYCIIDGQDTARLLRAYGKAQRELSISITHNTCSRSAIPPPGTA